VRRSSPASSRSFFKLKHSTPQLHAQRNRKQLGEAVVLADMVDCHGEDGQQRRGSLRLIGDDDDGENALLWHANVRREK
jgi:hypothetical protein